jgi:hypothetical protein
LISSALKSRTFVAGAALGGSLGHFETSLTKRRSFCLVLVPFVNLGAGKDVTAVEKIVIHNNKITDVIGKGMCLNALSSIMVFYGKIGDLFYIYYI